MMVISTHCMVPLNYLKRGIWLNLSLDIAKYFYTNYKGTYTIDSIAVLSHCKLRRIFMMNRPIDKIENNGVNEKECLEKLPKSVEYPVGVNYFNQLYSPDGIIESQLNDLRDPEPVRYSPLGRSKTPTGQALYNRNSMLKEDMKRNDSIIDQNNTSRFTGTRHHYRILKSPNMTSYSPLITKNSKKQTKEHLNKELVRPILRSRRSIISDYSSQRKSVAKLPMLNLKENKEFSSERKLIKNKREEQFNTFMLPQREDSDEIEEIIETEERTVPAHESNCMTPLYFPYTNHRERSMIDETIDSNKQIIRKDITTFETELEVNDSTSGYVEEGLMKDVLTVRPFTPPFGKLLNDKEMETVQINSKKDTLEVVFDPILKCYYEPKTGNYYHLTN